MARPLRHMPRSHTLFEVTIRTIQGRLLLTPSAQLNDLILGVIGRALELFPEVRIYVIKVASNHFHIILSAPDVRTLAGFMNHIDSNIAREAGRLCGWRDKFWSRRYRAIPILDDASLLKQTKYILSHGCKEGLVESPLDWPGVGCERTLIHGERLTGTWYDRAAMYEAERKGKEVRPEEFAIRYEVPLTRLPCLEDKSDEEIRAFYRKMVQEIEVETRERLLQEGRRPPGAKAVMTVDPHSQPRKSKRSPAPWCHASKKSRRKAYLRAYRKFVSLYRSAVERLRQGESGVHFPEDCFLPSFAFRTGMAVSAVPG